MKKRFLNLFLALALAVLVLPMAADAAEECTHKSGKKYTVENIAAKPATCTEDGNEAYIACTSCGQALEQKGSKYIEVEKPVLDALGHNITNTNPTYLKETITEPTCQTPGRGKYGCSREGCKAWSKLDIPVVACEAQSVAKVEPTCTTPGKHAGTSCKWCGKVMSGQGTIKALGHTEEEIPAVEATCARKGSTSGVKCSVCDEVLTEPEEIAATGRHTYGEPVVVKAPTCTASGTSSKTCTVCGSTRIEYPAKIAHKLWPKEKVEPTCIATGREAGKQCEYCKQFIEGGAEIPKVDHTPSTQMKSYRAATCQREGRAVYDCTTEGCDAEIERIFPKLTCNIVPATDVAPTCITTGLQGGTKCTSCENDADRCAWCAAAGNLVPQTVVAALGHNRVLDTAHPDYVAASCKAGGMDIFDCTRCGYDNVHVETPALEHDMDISVLKEATCTIKGMAFHQCKREGCGYWKYVDIPKLGHNKVVVPAVEPSCTATGLTAGEKCDRCGETFKAQSIVDKLSHAWKDVEAKAATCQEDGYNAHRACANCGETDGMTVIPANNTGHNYVNNKCTICGEYDPAHEHQGTGTVTTDSTCTTKGVKSFSCSGCDYTWTEDIAKKAHSYGADDRCTVCQKLNSKHEHSYAQTDYREPTCDIGGQVTKQCSVCGDTTQTTINALGHSYSNGRCIRCGTAAACTHSTTNTTVTREATCKQAGQKVTSCTGCGKVMGTETIPATGNHNYVNDYCTGCGQVDPYKKTADNQDVYPLG